MKRAVVILLFEMMLIASLFSQSPQAFKYQAIARNQSGNILSNWDIGLRISIIEGDNSDKYVYVETHQTTSNPYGIINIIIGEGVAISGDFASIQWGITKYHIKFEMDINGGTDYNEIGNAQLYAVPYALYAEQAGSLLQNSTSEVDNSNINGSKRREVKHRSGSSNSKFPAGGDSYLNVNTGKVGIGTSTPQAKLDVHGIIRTDSLFSTGDKEGLSDTINIVTDIDFSSNALRYNTIRLNGGIITFISPKSVWTNSVRNPLIPDTSTFTCGDPLLDIRDGNQYPTVIIGQQCWMAKGLNIGMMIDSMMLPTDNGIIEKYCYINSLDSCDKYGGLYNWNELMQYDSVESTEGICPSGWHIPADYEFKILEGTVDTQYPVGDPIWDGNGWRGEDAGKRLKSTSGWLFNDNGTDAYGFNGLPGGWHNLDGTFQGIGWDMDMWASTKHLSLKAYCRTLQGIATIQDSIWRWRYNRNFGMAVRCIKDLLCGETYIDYRDGQEYGTVQIGDQCWMTKNMNIGNMIDGSEVPSDNDVIEKYCYTNHTSNCDTYGGLYSWDEMMQYVTVDSSQGICPPGWHLPSDNEWNTLEGSVDSQFGVGDPEWLGTGWRGLDAGDNLKSASGWYNSGNGSDLFGFTALPGGSKNTGHDYLHLTQYGHFWSSTEQNVTDGWKRYFAFSGMQSNREFTEKTNGYSVRCLKN